MRITFHGAARTTTGSMHLVQVNGARLLLECGLYQGKRKEAFDLNRNLPLDPRSVDACVLSHAHVDHSGNLPTLVKKGFRGPIFCTPPTKDLCDIVLLDSAHLQEKDVEYVNKKRARQGKNPFEPLYDAADATAALARLRTVPYGTPVEVVPNVRLTYQDAGHILGSAFVLLDITEKGRTRRLFFTGDIGRNHNPILRDPVVVSDVDLLITESTYGNRLHPARENVVEKLAELCRKILDRSSRLVIPAFSVGRTQQLLYFFREVWEEKGLPPLPVYVDSPMSTKATQVHENHPECFNRTMLQLVRDVGNPFSMEFVTYVTDVQESKRLNTAAGPLIIVSASGMCEGGRILHHLKHSIEDEKNIILIVGYQAEHTLGRRLVYRESPIRIYGEEHALRAEVHSIQALSAHGDRNEMLDYFRKMGPEVEKAFVVHGDPDQQTPFAAALKDIGAGGVEIPERGQTFEL